VERRYDIRFRSNSRIYIDDYAHHPAEITAFLSSVKDQFPGRKLTGIFQPHLFSRTRDLAHEFARSLELLDSLILMEIYPAREDPIPGVSSSLIFNRVKLKEKVLVSREQVLRVIREQDPEVLLTMGAGDIDQLVGPISHWMKKR
jgi:UDP-N-acetylmuramate--alanine ligase